MIKAIKLSLREFKQESGLSVNIKKSEILFINTPPREQLEVRKESESELKLGIKKMKYLGVWIYKIPGKITEGNYRIVWKRMLKQMKSWKNKGLRRMSKIRALKMLIVPKIMYLFQALPGTPPPAKIKEWDRKLNYWIEGGKRPRVRKKMLIANEMEGGWGCPSLELYSDAFQIERVLELQIKNNKWIRLEKEINGIKCEEIIYRKWVKRDTDKLIGPMKGTMEVWKKWQGRISSLKSKMSSVWSINKDKELNLNRMIQILKEKGIDRVEQLYDREGRVIINRIEQWLGQQNWLQVRAIGAYLNTRENRDMIRREDTPLEKIIREKVEGERAQASKIYKMLTQAEGSIIQDMKRMWEMDLQITEQDMKQVVEIIGKIRNTRVRETRRKILHKWYRTPCQLAHYFQNGNSQCWHGCQQRGGFMHMIWECEQVQNFWQTVQNESNQILGTDWIITKEMAVIIKREGMGEFREIKEVMIESAQAVIVLGWKDKSKWTVNKWFQYLVDQIEFEIMFVKINILDGVKLQEAKGRWMRVKNYIMDNSGDQAIKNKLKLIYSV